METRIFTLGSLFSGPENDDPDAAVHITNLAGWDEPRVDITTFPMLFGNGAAILHVSEPEENIAITVHFDGVNVHNIIANVRATMVASARNRTPVLATRTFSGGAVQQKELYLTSVSNVNLSDDDLGTVTINAKCLNR